MFRIEVFQDGQRVVERTCSADSCYLGRDPDAFIVLKGWLVGKRQVHVSRVAGQLQISDQGGIGALVVNDRTVARHAPVLDADLIMVGNYTLRVHDLAAAGTQVPPPVPLEPTVADAPAHAQPRLAAAVPQRSGGDSWTSRPPEMELLCGGPTDADRPATTAVPARGPVAAPAAATPVRAIHTKAGIALRLRVHKQLIDVMDLRRVNVARMGDSELRAAVQPLIEGIVDGDAELCARISEEDRAALCTSVLNEVVGLGPLEELLADETVTEIMVNRHDEVFVERAGRLTRSVVTFSNDAAVQSAIERIVAPIGRRIDESSPMVDARLRDGSRVNAVIPPLALKGPSITIRKFSKHKLCDADLIGFGSVSALMMTFLKVAVERRANIIISGGTGSGKTTLLNVLSNYIPDDERIVTVEDAAELQLDKPNLVSLEARPPNIEGRGEIVIRDLVKNCLRMRPDRIVVGECRGGEALDMLQAMNTGHDGSLTTTHANTPRDCLSRLEVMTLMSGLDLPIHAVREQVCSAVDLIVQQTRFSCGSRRVTYISEVTGMESGVVSMQNIFEFQEDGFGPDGRIRGAFVATGHIPEFFQDLVKRGIPVDTSIFQRASEFSATATGGRA